jgi:Skp family chaperone for outer membrane proteins
MTKEELKKLIEGEGKTAFDEIIKESGLSKLDKATVENYLKTDNDGKSLLFSIQDNRLNKYRKEGEFLKDFETEFQKRNPTMTEEQKKLRDMEVELENLKREKTRSLNSKQLKDINKEFGLPDDVFEMLVGEDLESSKTKITEIGGKFKKHFEDTLQAKITEKLGDSPKPLGGTPIKNITLEQYESMSKEERMKVPMEQLNKLLEV